MFFLKSHRASVCFLCTHRCAEGGGAHQRHTWTSSVLKHKTRCLKVSVQKTSVFSIQFLKLLYLCMSTVRVPELRQCYIWWHHLSLDNVLLQTCSRGQTLSENKHAGWMKRRQSSGWPCWLHCVTESTNVCRLPATKTRQGNEKQKEIK